MHVDLHVFLFYLLLHIGGWYTHVRRDLDLHAEKKRNKHVYKR